MAMRPFGRKERRTKTIVAADPRPGGNAPDPFLPQLAAARALNAFRTSGLTSRPMALVASDQSTLALIHVSAGKYTSRHSLEELAARVERQFLQMEPRSARDWNAAQRASPPRPLEVLCWRLGKNLATRFGLAPWLAGDAAYRLISWPDFRAIGIDRWEFELAAQLTQWPMTAPELSAATAVAVDHVNAFLNAASLCGLLNNGPRQFKPSVSGGRVDPKRPPLIARLLSKLNLSRK